MNITRELIEIDKSVTEIIESRKKIITPINKITWSAMLIDNLISDVKEFRIGLKENECISMKFEELVKYSITGNYQFIFNNMRYILYKLNKEGIQTRWYPGSMTLYMK
jgi:hypothetical protein